MVEQEHKGLLQTPSMLGRQRAVLRAMLRYIAGKKKSSKEAVKETLSVITDSIKYRE